MKLNIYSVFDDKAEAFNTPFFSQNDNMATRSFNQACSDPNTTLFKNPEDFKLYRLGEFDDNSGAVEKVEIPVFIAHAQLNLKLKDTPNEITEPLQPT